MGIRVIRAVIVYNSSTYEILSWDALRNTLPRYATIRMTEHFKDNKHLQHMVSDLNKATGDIIIHGDEELVKDYEDMLDFIVSEGYV